jgi:Holliday junction resolvasome RuvABC endonuclease subunit
MPCILGLDPSLKKAGYVVFDTSKPDSIVEDKGLLKTSTLDGILVQRLIKQADQIGGMLDKYNISFVGMEAPFFNANSTEMLFALNQYIHKVFLEHGTFVVCFPPHMLKKLTYPDLSVDTVGKPHMIHKAKDMLNLHGHRLAEDVADAYWAGFFGKRFYKWHFEKSLKDEDLGEYERQTYSGTHTYSKGKKKGVTEYSGIVYRENELFFDFKEIKRRLSDAEEKRATTKKRGCGKTP